MYKIAALLFFLDILPACLLISPNPEELRLLNNLSYSLEKAGSLTDEILSECLDLLLANFGRYLVKQNLDFLKLPDTSTTVKVSSGIIPISGKFSLNNGKLRGLSTIYLRKLAVMKFKSPILSIQAPVGFRNTTVDYDYSLTLLGLGPKGGVRGHIENLKVTLDIDVNLHKIQLYLSKFKIDGSGPIKVTFSGFPLTDHLVEVLSTAVVNIFRKVIFRQIEGDGQKALQDAFADINKEIAELLGY